MKSDGGRFARRIGSFRRRRTNRQLRRPRKQNRSRGTFLAARGYRTQRKPLSESPVKRDRGFGSAVFQEYGPRKQHVPLGVPRQQEDWPLLFARGDVATDRVPRPVESVVRVHPKTGSARIAVPGRVSNAPVRRCGPDLEIVIFLYMEFEARQPHPVGPTLRKDFA